MDLVPGHTLRAKPLDGVKSERWFFAFIVVALAANILALVTLFRRYDFVSWLVPPLPEAEHVHLSRGERVPDFFGTTLDGLSWHSDSLKGRWGLVFYFRHRLPTEFLLYGDMLGQRYESRGLSLVGVTHEVSDELKRLVQMRPLSYPILVDRDDRVRDQLRWQYHDYGLVLIDPQGGIEFVVPRLLTKSDLRQLVEKYLLGRIRYQSEQLSIRLKPGDVLPSYRLMDVRSGRNLTLRELDLTDGIIVFFTASCSLYHVSRYFDELRAIELGRKGSGPYHFIFSHTFSALELDKLAREREIASPVYLAREPFTLLEPADPASATAEEDILVLRMTADGRVKTVGPLSDWVARIFRE